MQLKLRRHCFMCADDVLLEHGIAGRIALYCSWGARVLTINALLQLSVIVHIDSH